MSRYTRILPYNDNPARLFDTISKYLIMEGYTCQQINYENVFKKGNGILQLLLTHLLQRAKLLPPPVISAYMHSLLSPLVG